MTKLIVGTGTSRLTFRKTEEIVGIDINRLYLQVLKRRSARSYQFCVADATNLPFKDQTFEEIICKDVLEHISNANKAVEEMCRVLKEGGLLILQIPRAESEYFLSSYFSPYKKYITGKVHKHIFTNIWLPEKMEVIKDHITDAYGGIRWLTLAAFHNILKLDSKVKIDDRGQITYTNTSKIELFVAKLFNTFSEILARMFAPIFNNVISKKSKLSAYLYKSRLIIAKKGKETCENKK